MRRTIYKNICIIVALAVVVTTALSFFVYFHHFSGSIKKDVINESRVLAHYLDNVSAGKERTDILKKLYDNHNESRITLIDKDGKVIYDNYVKDFNNMENHNNRPEIKSAIENGTGEITRQSDTWGQKVYYYARRLSDGQVVRMSKTNDSMFEISVSVIPVMLFITFIILIISAYIANKLTRHIMEPINKVDLDNIDDNAVYDELKPFLKRIENENIERERIQNIRSEFSANVSHELKTPLTTISGYAQMITAGIAKPEDIQGFAQKIEKESERLILLINDIIKLSNLEEDNTDTYTTEKVDIDAVANHVMGVLENAALKRGIRMFYSGTPSYIYSSSVMIEEMIYNLVDNAIKYNKENGKIVVFVGSTNAGAEVSVKDSGIGIAEEEQDRIFERFYRVDKSHSKTVGGTGLGLSIVKHIAIACNAKITVKSRLGEGTTISVLFPKEISCSDRSDTNK